MRKKNKAITCTALGRWESECGAVVEGPELRGKERIYFSEIFHSGPLNK